MSQPVQRILKHTGVWHTCISYKLATTKSYIRYLWSNTIYRNISIWFIWCTCYQVVLYMYVMLHITIFLTGLGWSNCTCTERIVLNIWQSGLVISIFLMSMLYFWFGKLHTRKTKPITTNTSFVKFYSNLTLTSWLRYSSKALWQSNLRAMRNLTAIFHGRESCPSFLRCLFTLSWKALTFCLKKQMIQYQHVM